MAIRKYFWRSYLSNTLIFFLLIGGIVYVTRPDIIQNFLSKVGLADPVSYDVAHSLASSEYPQNIVPQPSTRGTWVEKPNYMLYYDQDIMQARFTLHKLTGASTRGEANRFGLRFNEDELIGLATAAYGDYSGSGFDRGHLVPAGDFRCCQTLMEETFGMSNIAPFDSLLNRYAWTELELKTRSWARRYGEVYVITGPVFEHRMQYFGRYNDVSVPTHFFKLIFRLTKNSTIPESTVAFVLPNEAVSHFVMDRHKVSIDQLEEMTELDFFKLLPDDFEAELEKVSQNGSW